MKIANDDVIRASQDQIQLLRQRRYSPEGDIMEGAYRKVITALEHLGYAAHKTGTELPTWDTDGDTIEDLI